MIELIIFYVFAAVLIFAATMVITARNPVHSALFLVLAFFNSGVLWLLAQAEFLGIAVVLVYVGAVMVLFLFVVMMLDINVAPLREGFARYLPVGVLVGAAMLLEMLLVLGSGELSAVGLAGGASEALGGVGTAQSNTALIGNVLYTIYVYPFEVAAVVLMLAIIAAIMLTLRRRSGTKHQDIAKQVHTRKAERLRVVHMNPEKRD
ncbi:NADH-quinone oxidoreductase subunit J [Arhodomonas aquaeolei]|nr:NADH-quinone oxidoreductase subunit J [Arhodomonas aquaeolei]MCS4504669.1 NADH-quinone oxidoreductase subunit J [Arhodomonas aquaeolei]